MNIFSFTIVDPTTIFTKIDRYNKSAETLTNDINTMVSKANIYTRAHNAQTACEIATGLVGLAALASGIFSNSLSFAGFFFTASVIGLALLHCLRMISAGNVQAINETAKGVFADSSSGIPNTSSVCIGSHGSRPETWARLTRSIKHRIFYSDFVINYTN